MPTTPRPYNEQTKESILLGKYANTAKRSSYFNQKIMKGLCRLDIQHLNTREFFNFIDYFIYYVDAKELISREELRTLFRKFHSDFLKRVGNLVGRPEDILEGAKRLVDLMHSISQREDLYFSNLTHDRTMLLAQLSDILERLIKKSDVNTSDTFYRLLGLFFETLRLNIENRETLIHGYPQIKPILLDLAKVCAREEGCNATLVLDKSFTILGRMAYRLSDMPSTHYAADSVFKDVLDLKEVAASRLTSEQLNHISLNFLSQRYPKQNISFITNECQQQFKLPDCGISEETKLSSLQPSPMSNHTQLASTEISDFSTTPSTDTLIILDDNDNSTFISNRSATLDNNLPLGRDGDITTLSPTGTHRHALLARTLSAFGLGIFTGFLDEASLLLLSILENKGYSKNSLRFVAVALALANSLAISTLPLMVSIINDIAEEEDVVVNSERILLSTYVFATSLILHGTKNGISYFAKNYLDNRSAAQFVINFLPFFACLWMIANGEESFLEGLSVMGVSLLGAAIPKIVVAGIKIGFFSCSSRVSYVSHETELSLLEKNSPTDPETPSCSSGGSTSSSELSLPDPSKVCYFVKLNKFEELKKIANDLIRVLKSVSHDLRSDEREKMNKDIKSLAAAIDCLNEERHHKACEQFPSALALIKSSDVTTLHSTLQFIFNKLDDRKSTINSIPIKVMKSDDIRCPALDNLGEEVLAGLSLDEKLMTVTEIVLRISGEIKLIRSNYESNQKGCQNTQVDPSSHLYRQASRDKKHCRRPTTLFLPTIAADYDSFSSSRTAFLSP